MRLRPEPTTARHSHWHSEAAARRCRKFIHPVRSAAPVTDVHAASPAGRLGLRTVAAALHRGAAHPSTLYGGRLPAREWSMWLRPPRPGGHRSSTCFVAPDAQTPASKFERPVPIRNSWRPRLRPPSRLQRYLYASYPRPRSAHQSLRRRRSAQQERGRVFQVHRQPPALPAQLSRAAEAGSALPSVVVRASVASSRSSRWSQSSPRARRGAAGWKNAARS
jgi:hypothetical protein